MRSTTRTRLAAAGILAAAQQQLMLRYCGAVYRYLLRAVRDPTVAEDLTQEFALRFIQGRFGQVDREQGRFRNYVKGALFRLVQDHYRNQAREPRPVVRREAKFVDRQQATVAWQ